MDNLPETCKWSLFQIWWVVVMTGMVVFRCSGWQRHMPLRAVDHNNQPLRRSSLDAFLWVEFDLGFSLDYWPELLIVQVFHPIL